MSWPSVLWSAGGAVSSLFSGICEVTAAAICPNCAVVELAAQSNLRQAFDFCDHKGEGKIPSSELGNALRSAGKRLTNENVERFKKDADTAGGSVDFDQFQAFYEQVCGADGMMRRRVFPRACDLCELFVALCVASPVCIGIEVDGLLRCGMLLMRCLSDGRSFVTG